jgi:hypothetical protein
MRFKDNLATGGTEVLRRVPGEVFSWVAAEGLLPDVDPRTPATAGEKAAEGSGMGEGDRASQAARPSASGLGNPMEIYLKAVEEGYAAAQFIVGLAHLEGYGVEKNGRSVERIEQPSRRQCSARSAASALVRIAPRGDWG